MDTAEASLTEVENSPIAVDDSVADSPADAGATEDSVMRAQVLETIDAIRPALQADGGDMSLVSVDEVNGVVEVQLVGACGSCPASTMTLKAGVERILKDRVPGVSEVRALGVDGVSMGADGAVEFDY